MLPAFVQLVNSWKSFLVSAKTVNNWNALPVFTKNSIKIVNIW